MNNTTDDVSLLRKLQLSTQSLKCLIKCSFSNSVINCFIYVHSYTSDRKESDVGANSKL